MKNHGKQGATKRCRSYPLKCLLATVLFSICSHAPSRQSMAIDSEARTRDREEKIIAGAKVESVFSSLLALKKNPEKLKALRVAHKDWLALRKSHCAASINQGVKKNREKLMECYESFDTQRIEIYNELRIRLLYDIPSQGKLPNDKLSITFSQKQMGQLGTPRSIVVSEDAPVTAVGFSNGVAVIFDLVNGQPINRIEMLDTKNMGFGYRLYLTPNGRMLIGCFHLSKTELKVWDVRTGELLRHKNLPQNVQAPTSRVRYFAYADRHGIGIYDVIKGEVTWNVGKDDNRVSLMAISPDDKYLILAGTDLVESWELVKGMDEGLSLVRRATQPVPKSAHSLGTIAFANDRKSFYITYITSLRGSIAQRRLPDLKEIRQLRFPGLEFVKLTEIKNTDMLLMEGKISLSGLDAFYLDMVGETAQKIAEHTGTNSRMAPLSNGRVLLATSYELKTLKVPSKTDFGKIGDIIGEVVSSIEPIEAFEKANDRTIPPPQINCQDFQIEAIGVHEGSLPNNRSRGFGERIAGYVDVHVRRTDMRVRLVLSSYEPVIWRVQSASDVHLSEVYLSGSSESRVEGIRNVMVTYIGNVFAYKDPDVPGSRSRHGGMSSLAEVVKQKTGCNIARFQGAYKGSQFYIGYVTKDLSDKNEIIKYTDENGNVIYRNY